MKENTNNVYTIQKGDTLSDLARRFGIKSPDPRLAPWEVLGRLNGINSETEARLIRPGQQLILPEGVSAQQSTVTTDVAPQETPQPVPETREPVPPAGTREAYEAIIIDKLTQQTPLNGEDIEALQTALKGIDLYHGNIDRDPRGLTCGAMIEFLKTENAQPVLTSLGPTAQGIINKYDEYHVVDRLTRQSGFSKEALSGYDKDIRDFLQKDEITITDKVDLMVSLNALGYKIKDLEVYDNKEISGALTEYLTENPEMMTTTSTLRFRDMMKEGYAPQLREIAQKTENFDERIQQQLDKMGNLDTASYQNVYALQTLLDLGSYKPGGLDGTVGSLTKGAVHRYKLENGIIKEPLFSVKEYFPDAANIPEIGTIKGDFYEEYDAPDHTNGFGVSDVAIDRVFSGMTGNDIQDKGTTPEDSGKDNPRPLIVIDLGHGADLHDIGKDGKPYHRFDSGMEATFEDKMHETHFIDPVGLALAEKLHEQGYQVAFTRNPGEQMRIEGGYFTTLHARPQFAQRMGEELNSNGVLFISIHANADAPHSKGTRIYAKGSNGRFSNENSAALAKSVGDGFSIGEKQTKLFQGDYTILRKFEEISDKSQINAAIVIETGFMTDPGDHKALVEMTKNPDLAASQIAQGIDSFVKANGVDVQLADGVREEVREKIDEIVANSLDCTSECVTSENGRVVTCTIPDPSCSNM